MCIFDDYPRFLDKVIREHLTTHRSRGEQIDSYFKDDCNDEEPTEKVIHVHEMCKFDDDSLRLDDLFGYNLVTNTPPRRKLNHVVRMYA